MGDYQLEYSSEGIPAAYGMFHDAKGYCWTIGEIIKGDVYEDMVFNGFAIENIEIDDKEGVLTGKYYFDAKAAHISEPSFADYNHPTLRFNFNTGVLTVNDNNVVREHKCTRLSSEE